MAFLVWKEDLQFHGWGCEDCGFSLKKPRIGESIGEYVATIRSAFDAHHCEDYAPEQLRQSSRLRVVMSAQNRVRQQAAEASEVLPAQGAHPRPASVVCVVDRGALRPAGQHRQLHRPRGSQDDGQI